jgi:hypothetical protein
MRYTSDIKILAGYVLWRLILRLVQEQSISVLKNVTRDGRTPPQQRGQRSLYRVYRFVSSHFETPQQRNNAGCNSSHSANGANGGMEWVR